MKNKYMHLFTILLALAASSVNANPVPTLRELCLKKMGEVILANLDNQQQAQALAFGSAFDLVAESLQLVLQQALEGENDARDNGELLQANKIGQFIQWVLLARHELMVDFRPGEADSLMKAAINQMLGPALAAPNLSNAQISWLCKVISKLCKSLPANIFNIVIACLPSQIGDKLCARAVYQHDTDLVRAFLPSRTATFDSYFARAFFDACQWGNLEMVQVLYSYPGINTSIIEGGHYQAVQRGHLDIVRFLHQNHLSMEHLSTVLCGAATTFGRFKTIQFLLTDKRIPARSVWRALRNLALSDHKSVFAPERLESAGLLLQDHRMTGEGVNYALREANLNLTDLIRLLIQDQRADNTTLSQTLTRAAEGGHLEIVRVLVHDPRISGEAFDDAIIGAARNGHSQIIRLLLQERRFSLLSIQYAYDVARGEAAQILNWERMRTVTHWGTAPSIIFLAIFAWYTRLS